jgi:tRNA(fMet)-specific endonuclease VapC
VTEAAFLLDSNICIYVLEGRSPPLKARIENCLPGMLATSAIAYAEVWRGLPADPSASAKAEALFEMVTILPFDAAAARAYMGIPFKGGTFDRLIAAHALSRNMRLITNNEVDFKDVHGLKVENWTLP